MGIFNAVSVREVFHFQKKQEKKWKTSARAIRSE